MSSNLIRTGVLLATLTAIFMGLGFLVNGVGGLLFAFAVAVAMNAYSYWNSDTVVLRMFKAQPIGQGDAPALHQLIGQLADRAGLPMPRVYLMDSPQPNAFATGRNPRNAAVCVSTGLIDTLTSRELAGVLAHELAHVRNRDTLTMTIAATFAAAISMFANLLQFNFLFGGRRPNSRFGWLGLLAAALLAPFAASLVQMAISRSREYDADRAGAELCGDPMWLASALAKIQLAVKRQPTGKGTSPVVLQSAAHLFIVPPLAGQAFDSLFLTHPATEARIAELERLAAEWRHAGGQAPKPLELGTDGAGHIEIAGHKPSEQSAEDQPSATRGPWG